MNRVRYRKARHATATHFEQVPLAEVQKGSAGRDPAGLNSHRAEELRAEAKQNEERNRKLAAELQELQALASENRARIQALRQAAAESMKVLRAAPASSPVRTTRITARADQIETDFESASGEDDDASPV